MESIGQILHSGYNTIVPFIVLLGILVFVHELGHFLVAKWCGVRVEVFSLGFGKKILQYKRGDTIYCISLIPLGGYVKMFGDEIGAQLPAAERKVSFSHKSVWQRIAIVLAGPLMNFFFAILIFSVIAALGEDFRKPVIGDLSTTSEAYKLGFRPGDEVLRVNTSAVKTWDEFQSALNESANRKTRVEVRRSTSDQLHNLETVPLLKANPNLLSTDSNIGDIPGITSISRSSVVGVRGQSIAQKWGLQTGDRILSVGQRSIQLFREIENALVQLQGTEVIIQVERSNLEDTKEKVPLTVRLPQVSSLRSLGIESPELFLAQVVTGSPAQIGGLQKNDRILKVGSVEPVVWEDILGVVKSYNGEGPLEFTVERGAEKLNFSLTPTMTRHMTAQGAEEKRFTVGIVPRIEFAQPDWVKVKTSGLGPALHRGWDRTLEISAMTVMGFLRLVQNKISPKNIGGVISIGQAASETFKIGLSQFLQMMAIISVNLFILNLLPIPVLDGGHLLFYTIEALRGAPVSMRKMEVAQQVGLVVLMSLMVFALFNDFSRIFGFW